MTVSKTIFFFNYKVSFNEFTFIIGDKKQLYWWLTTVLDNAFLYWIYRTWPVPGSRYWYLVKVDYRVLILAYYWQQLLLPIVTNVCDDNSFLYWISSTWSIPTDIRYCCNTGIITISLLEHYMLARIWIYNKILYSKLPSYLWSSVSQYHKLVPTGPTPYWHSAYTLLMIQRRNCNPPPLPNT